MKPLIISGSFLDRLYTNNETLQKISVDKTENFIIYFFDQDPVNFRLQNKY